MPTPIDVFHALGGTVNITAATSPPTAVKMSDEGAGGTRTVRVYNSGSVDAFIRFGTSAALAAAPASTSTSMPIKAGNTEVFQLRDTDTHISAITASSTAVVYATAGMGV
jgi:hypothetical protein